MRQVGTYKYLKKNIYNSSVVRGPEKIVWLFLEEYPMAHISTIQNLQITSLPIGPDFQSPVP